MKKIVFFCIPAYGHTNPTIPVVNELTKRGHEVWYYSFNMFKEKIESVGAKFISCDEYLPELRSKDEKKVGKDFAALIEMVVDTTISLDKKVCSELQEFNPDCIVSDSICIWGKLLAMKLNIQYICSTTTFAFNQYTAKMMKRGIGEIIRTIIGIPRVNKKMKLLKINGYNVKNFISLIQNDNATNTIVYTSKEFQPMSETFSDKYVFVGPSVMDVESKELRYERRTVYISLGTILNKNYSFYKNCIQALKECDVDVIMSVGEKTEISDLGEIPINFQVKARVDQIKVLKRADAFLTHCGMNSVSESLYYRVPMLLFPQHSEQALVAKRTVELGAGLMLKRNKPNDIKNAIEQILNDHKYKENADKISKSFKAAGGAKKAADMILAVINNGKFKN
ncbi:glucosyltransferase [Clostridium tyrobutyricum]|mgnify:CR=1 FL=1|jgi:MGT family glycosyltransferase|uniref:macrolide family glycosyltransferase n=1 Tax=Clostridium tyrobutyricum TaxID=1519 RepID=UPI00073D68D1|nr:macrolide family glycosyltransferase [Clostridium tyrobutyricum]MBR9649059.1 glucosyltransferase [Clostridium tyrobutyricum]MBV4420439.1 glucosyltransferase [Clostridium tyrobutyricum]MBV4447603.1 glucosyltransferase [Clostridium tyrobutyricum]MBV4450463.1 glucosyltransferase [Clostridium tyrobutyricum]MCH4198849.1 glucosyltransferase [Clostridium tyrobutyricum]